MAYKTKKQKKLYYIKEPFGLPRELQPKDKFYTEEEVERKDISMNMKILFKEKTSGENKFKTLTKKEVFKMTKGNSDDKEDMFKRLEEDGEIYQAEKGKYRWIG